ncbi:DUF6572 domain-containing protein [Flavobacterium hydatis]|uniref:Uncharacterized protein n=1 Tax=Flavobacterium hydatis TaxID=991 RepID=A0A086AIM7_FLAHY|nr:DUF6572 domain-containing protein [Flavobacterium hydatis]KFF16541.1 hypothetical protein IW20_10250 [Flavobacterium hydatis]OXA90200.1 hypothetical protein B0A62_19190 [Flavobacterium hydatis]
MSIEDKNLIDLISVDKQGILVLTISDHLKWDDKNEHLLLLQEKINIYLDFIENGQLDESYPDKADKKIMIQIVFKYQPNKTAEDFLEKAGETVKGIGYGFNFYQLNQ